MGKIKRLDDHLTNMIAAGEVVERPMGVVKELIENALDASASSIEIRINQGGIESIEVSDDGEGMDESDLSMAFERHATSKISTAKELFAPKTLGFRGEALPSIASVAKVTATSSNGLSTNQIIIEYGTVLQKRSYDRPQGTSILVEGLFRRTPARLKHLKTVSYESALITDLVEKMALCRKDVAFKLIADEQVLLRTTGRNDWLETLAMTYGNRLARLAHPFTCADHDFKVEGLWLDPQENKSNNKAILIFLNQRVIRFYPIQKAVTEAYQNYIPPHRYPMVILNITADASLADVNVHPSKWEVKLSKEQQLYYLIVDSLSKAIHDSLNVKDFEPKSIEPLSTQQQLFEPSHYPQAQSPIYPEVKTNPQWDIQETPPESSSKHPTFPVLDLIGQIHGRYIIASDPLTLYFIDQHAAKERINYEKILKQIDKKISTQQTLLMPLVVALKPSLKVRFESIRTELQKIGIDIELFSESEVIIRSTPLWLKEGTQEAFLNDLLERYEDERNISTESLRKAALATTACHKSVRFNQQLTPEDMKQILEELSHCDQPYHCPHGRPTLIKIATKDLWRDFER
ncbi:MAG: DNA mismatch repair protein MutL [Erysipelotrichaceae bacterium]|nr:MAG: DNA mismatch repair protein [Erysipelotrichaceae bacterium]TXT19935.1 MAG: DNA mismatch repair protein MutL [Erysipelotrichaceae bacterium]